MAGISGGHNAVKEVNASGDTFNDIGGRTDAHEITRLILGHMGFDRLDDLIHDLGAFADSQTADGITGQVKLCDLLHMPDANLLISAALIDAPKLLGGIDGIRQGVQAGILCFAPQEPTVGSFRGGFYVIVRRGIFHAFIERHANIGTEV